MEAENDNESSLLDKLRARYPLLMFYQGETSDRGKFIHAWKPALTEDDPSIGNFLPYFHAILQTTEEKVTCRLFSYNGKHLKTRTTLINQVKSSFEERGVPLLESLQETGLCLGFSTFQKMHAALANPEGMEIKDFMQTLLVEHLGDRVVYRHRNCAYITASKNESHCSACLPFGMKSAGVKGEEPSNECDEFEGFQDGDDWIVNFEEDPPKMLHSLKEEEPKFAPLGGKIKVEVKEENCDSGADEIFEAFDFKEEDQNTLQDKLEDVSRKMKQRRCSNLNFKNEEVVPVEDDQEKENDGSDSDFDIADFVSDQESDGSLSDQEMPKKKKSSIESNKDHLMDEKRAKKPPKLPKPPRKKLSQDKEYIRARNRKRYNDLPEEKKKELMKKKSELQKLKRAEMKSLKPVLSQEEKDPLLEKMRRKAKEKSNLNSRRYRAGLTKEEKDTIREKKKWHRIEKELSGKYLCQICLKAHGFKSMLDKCMNLHKQSFDLSVPCTCPVCHTIIENRHILTSHFSEEHSPKTCCPFCLFVVENNKDSLRKHIFRRHHSEKPCETHICEHCSAVFTSKRMLQKHIIRKHEEVTMKTCPKCGKSVKAVTFYRHIKTHTKNLSCLYCNEVYSDTQMHQHLRKHFNINPYSCNLCNYFSYRISNVKTHFKRHPGQAVNIVINERLQDELLELDRKAMVEIKQKAATNLPMPRAEASLNICEHCSATFSRKNSLLVHVEKKHRVSMKMCPECGKSVNSVDFLKHVKTHDKNLSCLYCTEVLNEQGMRQHLRTHFDINPYSCNLCTYTSYRSSNVMTHFKRHPGEAVNVVENIQLRDKLSELQRKAMIEIRKKAAHTLTKE